MATYAAFKHVELHKIGHGKNRVPNAPRSRISEIFNGDEVDGRANGARNGRVRSPRETPTRPRDTHSRLFGQGEHASPPAPLITDTVRSNIRFDGNGEMNGSASSSPAKSPLLNGSGPQTPNRGSYRTKGNPITGDGYKSLNGEINTAVTALNGNRMPINHNRIPPGGFSSGLW